MKKTVAVFFLCAFLFSCPKDEKTVSESEQDFPEAVFDEAPNEARQKIDQFLRNGLSLAIGDSLAEIEANLGPPLKRNVLDRQNIHDATKTDRLYELFYDGLFLRVYHVTESNRDIVVLIEVTGEKYTIQHDLRVGSAKEKVIAALGHPDEEEPDLLRYFAGEFVYGSVEFFFRDDKLTTISWNFFID